MNRRRFATAAIAAALTPPGAWAQAARRATIGYLSSGPASPRSYPLAALKQGLLQEGFVAGDNLEIEHRWADNHYDRLGGLATDLVQKKVAVIVAAGGTVTPLAARSVTATTPIVFTGVSDPVQAGLVASMSRPGGNVTGVNILGIELDAKRLELLHTVAPGSGLIGVLVNPNRPETISQKNEFLEAARAIGREVLLMRASSDEEVEQAIDALAQRTGAALVVAADPLFVSKRELIVTLAARHALPAIYQWRDFVEVGGLMSYGSSLEDAYTQAGKYVGRILKGEKPADLPVIQSARIELVLNLSAAKALGISFPQSIILRANEVVE